MKEGIHPQYKEIKVSCSCGNSFTTASTACKDLHLEVCSKCHPFYTGKQKIVDTAGRVDRFKQKYARKAPVVAKSQDDAQSAAGKGKGGKAARS